MIKAVFFDIDGTLVSYRTKTMPAETYAALQLLHEKGIRLSICTGRAPVSIQLLEPAVRSFPWDGVIAANGQLCFDEEQKLFHKVAINADTLKQLVPWIKDNQIPAVFFEVNDSYTNLPIPSLAEHYQRSGKPELMPGIDDPVRSYEHETIQICPYVPKELDEAFLAHAPGMKSVRWADHFADMIPSAGGKDKGIEAMLKHWNIKREETMAIGDGGNDISMVQYAGVGVAMGNAPAKLKEAADFITNDVDHNGIVNALKEYGLL